MIELPGLQLFSHLQREPMEEQVEIMVTGADDYEKRNP